MWTRTTTTAEWTLRTAVIVFVLGVAVTGCSRLKYVQRADRDAYSILNSRTDIDPKSAPTDLSVLPSPTSRLFDPTPIDAPTLPDPRPQLYSYAIPDGIGVQPQQPESLPEPTPEHNPVLQGPVIPAIFDEFQAETSGTRRSTHEVKRLSSVEVPPRILLTRLAMQEGIPEPNDDFSVTPLTVPRSAWEAIPRDCRIHLFEFRGIREQYQQSFGIPVPVDERDNAHRLRLEDILQLALLNSREYQAQKEQLYRVALQLSLEEYDYRLKFAPFGNSTGARYEHIRSNSGSQSDLQIPSQVQLEALATTGSSLVTRFANDVLLTFNGPDGFAADISSELLFGVSQSVFQNDVRFERLTQAERNVIYAARDFARFRRTFYLQLATQYYNLLRTYRQIEIDAQNYLSLVRVYGQREVEFGAGEVARVQMDQVEQNTLAARSNLLANCNLVENTIDQFKLQMGIPTETAIQLDLAELQSLTQQDERLVRLQLVKRVESRLVTELARAEPDVATLLNLAGELVSRIYEAAELEARSASESEQREAVKTDLEKYRRLQAWLRTAERRTIAGRVLNRLRLAQNDGKAPAVRVPELAAVYVRNVVALLKEELALAKAVDASPDVTAAIESSRNELAQQLTEYETFLDSVLGGVQIQQLPEVRRRADELVNSAAAKADAAAESNATSVTWKELGIEETAEATIRKLLKESHTLAATSEGTLPSIDLDFDAASLTGLMSRLDLANTRGAMFDEWRGSKLAADDLKSILNLQARQRLITQNQVSQPLDLDLDESRTELSVTIDTPLNRRFQRNTFREQLLNYQLARRDVMALEDDIKLDIRTNLRSIRQSREQHELGIASAALAYERVISTELQLRLGVPGVAARDYLEAQTAYANSLSTVAARHIGYIIGRISLFTDLEQLQLDSLNHWPGLHDPTWQPDVATDWLYFHDYGQLPSDLHYSKELRERSKLFWGTPIVEPANETREANE